MLESELAVHLSDDDIERLRTITEDSRAERKVLSDKKDWRAAVTSFANSMPVGFPAVVFIGVRDKGEVEPAMAETTLDKVQKSLAEEMAKCYPPVDYICKGMKDASGQQYLAVVVPGSTNRPHFTGRAYVREGSRRRDATDVQFQAMITERSGKVYEIRKWIGKAVSIRLVGKQPTVNSKVNRTFMLPRPAFAAEIVDCNAFYVTYNKEQQDVPSIIRSLPLHRVALGYDHSFDRLELEVRDPDK